MKPIQRLHEKERQREDDTSGREREDDDWTRDGAVESGCYVSIAAVQFPLLELCTLEDSLLKQHPVELLMVRAASIRDTAV